MSCKKGSLVESLLPTKKKAKFKKQMKLGEVAPRICKFSTKFPSKNVSSNDRVTSRVSPHN